MSPEAGLVVKIVYSQDTTEKNSSSSSLMIWACQLMLTGFFLPAWRYATGRLTHCIASNFGRLLRRSRA